MSWGDPTSRSKVERFERARDAFRPLLEDGSLWQNECEKAFSEFRVACVHLRKDSALLDAVEDKEVVWRFMCKFSKDRKPFWVRCEEVLTILMGSDTWMKAFADDPNTSTSDLPAGILKEFDQRIEDVAGSTKPPGKRLVIIGCNSAALRHCALMERYNDRVSQFFQIVGLFDPDPAKIATFRAAAEAKKLSRAEDMLSVEDWLARDAFDAAAVFTMVDRERVLQMLLERGKVVLAGLPLGPDFDAAVRIAQLSRARPPVQNLIIAETGAFWPEVLAASETIQSGSLGEATGIDARPSPVGPESLEPYSEGVGCLMMPGLQWFRSLRRLVGPIEAVFGLCRSTSLPVPSVLRQDAKKTSKLSRWKCCGDICGVFAQTSEWCCIHTAIAAGYSSAFAGPTGIHGRLRAWRRRH